MLKFGRKPTILPSKTLRLGDYLDKAIIQPPPSAQSWTNASRVYGMLGNNKVGNCVEAAIFHALQDEIEDNGAIYQPTDADAIGLYSTLTGYVPGDESTDQGTNPAQALTYWQNIGIAGHKISGYVQIDGTNLTELQCGIWLFGTVFFAWDVPAYAMDQFSAGENFDIDPTGDATIQGGHETPMNGYDGTLFNLVTWGKETGMTAAFAAQFAEIPLVAVSDAWIAKSGTAPNGFAAQDLISDLKAITI